MRYYFIAATLILCAPFSANAAVGTASAVVVERLTIASKEPLNFGYLDPVGSGGQVTITTANERQIIGAVQASGNFNRARFEVQGTPGAAYSIQTPASQPFVAADLSGTLNVRQFTVMSQTSASLAGLLNDRGEDTVFLGGTIDVPAGAMPGVYSGMVLLTVSY